MRLNTPIIVAYLIKLHIRSLRFYIKYIPWANSNYNTKILEFGWDKCNFCLDLERDPFPLFYTRFYRWPCCRINRKNESRWIRTRTKTCKCKFSDYADIFKRFIIDSDFSIDKKQSWFVNNINKQSFLYALLKATNQPNLFR